MFCTFTSALPPRRSMCAVPSMAIFCVSFISCFPGMLLRYCLRDFGNGSSRPYYYRYHFCCNIPLALNFYHEVFMFYNFLAFYFSHISVSRNSSMYLHAGIPCLLSQIMMSVLFFGIVSLLL